MGQPLQRSADDFTRWTVRLNANPNTRTEMRLFCFPYAGGGASVFRSWGNLLAPSIESYAVQLPGRETRIAEAPYECVSEVAAKLAPLIERRLDKPFAFFGHSLGAFVCFELARFLRTTGLPLPCHLFVAGQRAPHLPDPDPPIHHLSDPDFIDEIQRRYDGISTDVVNSPELMQLLMISLRADFKMTETYRYRNERPLDCPITVLGGHQDDSTTSDHLAGWALHTFGHCDVRMFSGDHFFIEHDRAAVVQTISQIVHETHTTDQRLEKCRG
jgi:surfactin synthase thioesterase subunit